LELKESIRSLAGFTRHPARTFSGLAEAPDVMGALLMIDLLSFLTALWCVVSGGLEFSFTWRFLFHFLVLYALMFVLQCMFVAFEGGCVMLAGRLLGSAPDFRSLFSAMAYCRLPLVLGTTVYIFIPEKLNLLNVLNCIYGPAGHSALSAAFLDRLEVFELMVAALQVIAVYVMTGFGGLRSLATVAAIWLAGTAIFHYVVTLML
jgi:hypothetical protein